MDQLKTTYDAATKVWSGPQIPKFYDENTSLGETLLEVLLENPQDINQICYPLGKSYKNVEIAQMAISTAQHCAQRGLQQGDLIGICAANTEFLAPLVFGALFQGLTISPLDKSYEKEIIKHVVGKTKPKIMFCDGDIYEKVKAALQESGLDSPIYTLSDHIKGVPSILEFLDYRPSKLEFDFEPLKMGVTQTSFILPSSGTTGPPKLITISYEDLLEAAFSPLKNSTPGGKYLCFSLISWISGLNTLLNGTFSARTRIISDKPFSADDFFDICAKYQPTVLLTAPAEMASLLASPKLKTADLSSIRMYVFGGGAVSPAQAKQLQAYMPSALFIISYAMTEARGGFAAGLFTEAAKSGLIGTLVPNTQMKVVDDKGRRLGPNEVGEFCFKDPRKWLGYFDDADATAAAHDAEGWFITGDIGYFDEVGKLNLIDRKKHVLKYNDLKFFPAEIEQVIHELPDVLKVAVCRLPDSTDLLAALVQKKAGSTLSEQQISEHIAQRMEHFKHLNGGVFFLEQLPSTPSGKILRDEVKQICQKLWCENS